MTGLTGSALGWPWWRLGVVALDGGLLVLLAMAMRTASRFHDAAARLRLEAADMLGALAAAETTLGQAMTALAAASHEVTARSERIADEILTFERHLSRGEGLRRELSHRLPLAELVLARIGAIVEAARQPEAVGMTATARPTLVTAPDSDWLVADAPGEAALAGPANGPRAAEPGAPPTAHGVAPGMTRLRSQAERDLHEFLSAMGEAP